MLLCENQWERAIAVLRELARDAELVTYEYDLLKYVPFRRLECCSGCDSVVPVIGLLFWL